MMIVETVCVQKSSAWLLQLDPWNNKESDDSGVARDLHGTDDTGWDVSSWGQSWAAVHTEVTQWTLR